MRQVDGRWYWRPTDEATRMVLERLAPGRAGLPAGPQNGDKHAARKWWADTIVPAIARVAPSNLPEPGRMEEIFERYEREVLPTLTPKTQDEHRRYLKRLRARLGTERYARSEAEA
jgi:hypothetical protein